MRTAVFLVVLLAFPAVGGGQKGALSLRDTPPPSVKPPKPEAYQPVPYPAAPGASTSGTKQP